ncbi:MAG: hypothetical protein ACSHXZ_00395 [Gammaproteobacteria bacterium]
MSTAQAQGLTQLPSPFTQRIFDEVAVFDEATGLLEVPVLITGLQTTPGQVFRNVRFKLDSQDRLELQSYRVVEEDEECTRKEIENAFLSLNLSMSLSEIEKTIGCPAVVSLGEVDLDKGLLATADWAAADGVPFEAVLESEIATHNIGFFERTTGIGLAFFPNLQVNPYLRSASNGPYISAEFREGVAQKISYKPKQTAPSSKCEYDILQRFEQINTASNISSVNALLGCDGNLIETGVSLRGELETFSWQANTFSSPTSTISAHGSSVIIQAQFQDGLLREYSLIERGSLPTTNSCSIEALTDATAAISSGLSLQQAIEIIPCDPNAWQKEIVNGVERLSADWQTRIPNNGGSTLLETKNRLLVLSFIDKVLVKSELVRR